MSSPAAYFQDLMERIRCRSEQIAVYLTGNATYPRRWMDPPGRGWTGDPLTIEDLKYPFERIDLNQQAEDEFSSGGSGTVGHAAGAELQIVYMGMMERAFRLRHMTTARAEMHAAGRRTAHGDYSGIHTGDIIAYIQSMLNAGDPPSATP